MATTVAQLHTELAHRLGEIATPNDVNEKARRLTFFNLAYKAVMRRHYWWFLETTGSFTSVANQESYTTADGFPTDVRKILEVRYGNTIITPALQSEVLDSETTPYNEHSESYMMFQGKFYPIPRFMTDGITVSLKYYKNPPVLTADADVIVIPDMFSDALVAYAEARVSKVKGKRGSSADGFDEFNEIIKQMDAEQNKYLFYLMATTNSYEAMYP
jgi:hypothetical protein